MTTGINKFLGGKALGDLPAFPDAVGGGGWPHGSISELTYAETPTGRLTFPTAVSYTSTMAYITAAGAAVWSDDGRGMGAGAGIDLWGPCAIDHTNDSIVGVLFNDTGTHFDFNYYERVFATGAKTNKTQEASVVTNALGTQISNSLGVGALATHLDASNFTFYFGNISSPYDITKVVVSRSTGLSTVSTLYSGGETVRQFRPSYVSQDETILATFTQDANYNLNLYVFRGGKAANTIIQKEQLGKSFPYFAAGNGYALPFMAYGYDSFVIASLGYNTTCYGPKKFLAADLDQWFSDVCDKLGI